MNSGGRDVIGKRLLAVLVTTGCLTGFSGYGATDKLLEGMGRKAVRGAINSTTGLVEIPMQVYKGFDKGLGATRFRFITKPIGAVLGVFRGVGHAAGRTSWGYTELFGFWTANPEDNVGFGIPLDAEYPWQYGTQHSFLKPSLKEGLMPYPRKLARAASDLYLGMMEIPAQYGQGAYAGEPLTGAARGVWYWLSRQWYGTLNLPLFMVPNPRDNPGVAFNTDWPWTGYIHCVSKPGGCHPGCVKCRHRAAARAARADVEEVEGGPSRLQKALSEISE
jgi:hypothetical protein